MVFLVRVEVLVEVLASTRISCSADLRRTIAAPSTANTSCVSS